MNGVPVSALLPAAVLVPVIGAALTLLLPRARQVVPGLLATAASAAVAGGLVVSVMRDGPLRHTMSGWNPPLGIVLRADGLAAAFIGLTAVVGLAVAISAASEERSTGERPGFWPLSLLTWAGLVGVLLAGDLFNAYVAIEVLGLAAVGLVALGGPDSARAAGRYLIIAVVGSMLLLLAVGLVYAATGTLDMALAGTALAGADPVLRQLPLALAGAGLALKSALVPAHAWLPPAHAGAPAAVSPLLSALVVKGSLYLLLRLWLDVLGPDPTIGLLLAAFGALAVVWGGVVAVTQQHLKRIVAYSTVTQIGYCFLGFGLLALASDDATRAAVVGAITTLALAHGLAKASIFLVAGSLYLGTGTDRLDGLTGTSHHQRVLTAAMMIAAISLIGLPISLGFAGKWQYLVLAIEADAWWIVVVLLAGSVLSAGYLLRPIATVFRDSDTTQEVGRVEPESRPAAQRHVPLALALLALFAGMGAGAIADLAAVIVP